MKKGNIIFSLLILLSMVLQSCNDTKTYAEMKDDERKSVQKFISEKGIKVISFEEFCAQDSTTDVSKNEFVLFKEKGVYMQIVRKGDKKTGKRLANGDHAEILSRYTEYYVEYPDSVKSTNMYGSYSTTPDKFTVTNSKGTYYASFDTSSLMYLFYQSQSVPAGWLIPLPYIYLARWVNDDAVAKVNLIVPHDVGQSDASQYVYACYYELTYQLGK